MLPTPCHVISDLHIGAAPPAVERRLVAFLEQVRATGGSLVVNGDLFDFWFEWRSVIPRVGFRALAALAAVRDAGLPVVWLQGNHDGWGDAVLREDVGADYRRDWRGSLAGWPAYVHHGDGLRALEDRSYRRLLRVIRHPLAIRAFRLLHPDAGSRLAHGSSSASRKHGRHDEGAGLREVAFRLLAAEPALRLVVFAHSHVPTLVRAPGGGVYANAGSWLDAPTYLRVVPERIELRRYDGSAEGEGLDALDRLPEEAPAQS
jgi:UDP-2,3-diacylglucosamine hydrolase